MGLNSQPAAFILSVEVGVWKPDAGIFDLAFQEIGAADRTNTVMVGDTVDADIAGGKAAGLRTALMVDSFELPRTPADTGGADVLVTGFGELQEHWFGQ